MTNQQLPLSMNLRVIDFVDANPSRIDMSSWHTPHPFGSRMCVAGITYMLAYDEDALVAASDSGECDKIERIAQRLLGINTKSLFHEYRWSYDNYEAYVTAKHNDDQRGMADATIAEISLYI